MALLAGIHAVREALRAGRPIERVSIARGAGGARLQEIIDLCRQAGVPVRFEPREALDRMSRAAPHQGVVAVAAAQRASKLEDVLARAGLLVVLDGVEDPHNFGAIIRTAYAAGATAVVAPERRAAPLSEAAAKAAAGALSLLPVVRVTNINRALEEMKQAGFWIYGVDERGSTAYYEAEYSDPAALVFGGEGRGLHELTRKRCDFLLRIPMSGQIASLNVSVAAGIVLFDWRRRMKPAEPPQP
ncbi:MAG: 23S rRNA (guanosine(2251)-2'-O)-methyltransferase RlmB [Bryobacteraceae bacterium]|nr:MAG: 23S rRNA (guanosine(2251)-2'-O)-methyltransferase RlmB [Bryobacteraceae bacterium]